MIEEYKKALAEEKAAKKKVAQLKAKILEENKPNGQFGTFHFGDFDIVIAKKVEWDQDMLAVKACNYNFVKMKYGISETLYKELPDEIKREFEAARAVKQGTVSIKIKEN